MTASPAERAGRRAGGLSADIPIACLVLAIVWGVVAFAREWVAPPAEAAPQAATYPLVACTFFSLSRGVIAYGLSLVFAVGYGKLAASSRRAERFLLPLLDVLQSIPVLSFMPGFLLGLVAMFPGANVGLELACVLAMFSSQAWNLAFSFHASLRAIPAELHEVARMHHFSPTRRLLQLEIPGGLVGLVWNSMMSMAGGWFFLTVVESIQFGDRKFCLPGLGSTMAAAAAAGDTATMLSAIAAMVVMIVALDQLLWRPAIAWSERFMLGDTAGDVHARSWFLKLLRRSRLTRWQRGRVVRRRAAVVPKGRAGRDAARRWTRRTTSLAALAALVALGALGVRSLYALIGAVPWLVWAAIGRDLGFTALRVFACVAIGVLWTVPAGIAIGTSARLTRWLTPVIQIGASFPAPMLFPLAAPIMHAAGVPDDVTVVVLMALGTHWYILFNVIAGAAATPRELSEVAHSFHLPRWRRFLFVDVAGALPALVTGVITAAGGAWNASVVAEIVQSHGHLVTVDGIGARIASAFAAGDQAQLAASTVALALALVLIHRLAWRPLQHIAATRFAVNR